MLINLNSNYNIPDRLDTTTVVALTSVPFALIVVVISRSYIICVVCIQYTAVESKYIIISYNY